jgi:hypothetical protein
MSHLLLFWLFVLLDLVKDADHFIGSLTLLKKGDEPKQVCGHCLVFSPTNWLREEDLFTLLLRCGQLHCSMDVATVKVAEELYLMPHEFMHQHEA